MTSTHPNVPAYMLQGATTPPTTAVAEATPATFHRYPILSVVLYLWAAAWGVLGVVASIAGSQVHDSYNGTTTNLLALTGGLFATITIVLVFAALAYVADKVANRGVTTV